MKNPCFGCDHRTAECHPTCTDYLAWAKRFRLEKEKVNQEKFKPRSIKHTESRIKAAVERKRRNK